MDSYPDGREYGSRAKRLKLDVGEAYSLAEGPVDAHRPVYGVVDTHLDSTEGNYPENMLLLFPAKIINMADECDTNGGHVCRRGQCAKILFIFLARKINKFAFNLMSSVCFSFDW